VLQIAQLFCKNIPAEFRFLSTGIVYLWSVTRVSALPFSVYSQKSLKGVRLVYQSSSSSGKQIQRGSLPTFRLAEYFHKLETTSLGTVIMATSKVASTQDLMKQCVPSD
jgi:hypothetical protein